VCRGVPGRVVTVTDAIATVDFWGVVKPVRLELLDEPVTPGDYVFTHLGRALRRIPPEDVSDVLALYEA
jgi:hydrogenase expression/formation protein HypC